MSDVNEQTNQSTESMNRSDSNTNPRSGSDIKPLVKSHSLRRLLVFQLKLAIDAFRDILLSPVSIICTVIDYFEKKHGADSHFEKLMIFGRNTEHKINLFEQHQKGSSTVDSVVDRVEEVIINEYQNKNISKKTMAAIQQALKKDKTENPSQSPMSK